MRDEQVKVKTTESQRGLGIYHKYNVSRVDGQDGPTGRHFGCKLFVLDLDHDKHARAAAAAYAESCRDDFPVLSRELRALAMTAGQRAYDAYCGKVGGTTYDGKPLPTWDELGERQRVGWEAAAEASHDTVTLRMEHTP